VEPSLYYLFLFFNTWLDRRHQDLDRPVMSFLWFVIDFLFILFNCYFSLAKMYLCVILSVNYVYLFHFYSLQFVSFYFCLAFPETAFSINSRSICNEQKHLLYSTFLLFIPSFVQWVILSMVSQMSKYNFDHYI
jgi:hypothetical protein